MAFLRRRWRKLTDEIQEFFGCPPGDVPVVRRSFSAMDLPNLELAIQAYEKENEAEIRRIGYIGSGISDELADMVGKDGWLDNVRVGPVQYRSVDIDVDQRIECLERGLYLITAPKGRIVVLLRRGDRFGCSSGLEVEVMTAEPALASAFVEELRERVHHCNVYRGKIISLGAPQDMRQIVLGLPTSPIAFHRMPKIAREEVILPEATLTLIERNTLGFSSDILAEELAERGRER